MKDRTVENISLFRRLKRDARRVIREQTAEQKLRAPGKYDRQLVALKLAGLFYPGLETGYHFGRAVDDMADGDVPLPAGYTNFSNYADFLRTRLDRLDDPTTTTGRAEKLLVATMPTLIKKEKYPGEAIGGARRFIDVMEAENQRRKNGQVLTKDELDELNKESFGASANMAFIAIGSRTRAEEIPELALSQAKAYALRDLKQEIQKGICNIPLETLQESGIRFSELSVNPDLIDQNSVFRNWIESERQEALSLVENLKNRKTDRKADLLIWFLTSKVNKICNSNFEKT